MADVPGIGMGTLRVARLMPESKDEGEPDMMKMFSKERIKFQNGRLRKEKDLAFKENVPGEDLEWVQG